MLPLISATAFMKTCVFESNGLLETDDATVSQRAIERGMKSLGTLGSGNHFLELQTVGNVDDEPRLLLGGCLRTKSSP